jgi:hypothetical protein
MGEKEDKKKMRERKESMPDSFNKHDGNKS